MHSTERIIKELATIADQIQTHSDQEHGDVAMILYTLCNNLSTREGREHMASLMLEVSSQLT